ncbi:MAG: hypothetical protein V4702_04290 [Patescibacteria group bacterium]
MITHQEYEASITQLNMVHKSLRDFDEQQCVKPLAATHYIQEKENELYEELTRAENYWRNLSDKYFRQLGYKIT